MYDCRKVHVQELCIQCACLHCYVTCASSCEGNREVGGEERERGRNRRKGKRGMRICREVYILRSIFLIHFLLTRLLRKEYLHIAWLLTIIWGETNTEELKDKYRIKQNKTNTQETKLLYRDGYSSKCVMNECREEAVYSVQWRYPAYSIEQQSMNCDRHWCDN